MSQQGNGEEPSVAPQLIYSCARTRKCLMRVMAQAVAVIETLMSMTKAAIRAVASMTLTLQKIDGVS